MELSLLYWHWIVFGIVLMSFEMFIPTFTILWFGAAAVIVGLILLIFPDLHIALQLLSWALFSGLFAWLWFKYLKPLSVDKTKAGLSREAIIGEAGQVLRLPLGEERGRLRFPAPILGDDEWLFICQDELALGDRVRVTEVSGNALIVVKV